MTANPKFVPFSEISNGKRLFLKTSLLGAAGAALSACGGSGSDEDPNFSSEDERTPVEYVDVPDTLTPPVSEWDLHVNPLQRALGVTQVRVIQDGLPLAGVPIEGTGADGALCFSGFTDNDGAFSWEGERTLGLHISAHGPLGRLSHYAVQDPAQSLAPLVLNVATTLADRVRQIRQWLPSQAETRVQRFLSIRSNVDLSITFIDHHELDHARFAQARSQSGLTQDAFIDNLAELAAADDYDAHIVDFGDPTLPEPDTLGISSTEFLEEVLRYAKLVNDANFLDKTIVTFFGALTLDIIGHFLPKDDPVMRKLNEISKKIDDVQKGLDAILKELQGFIEESKRAGLAKLDINLAQLNLDIQIYGDDHEAIRTRLFQMLREFNLHNDLAVTEQVLGFFGGFGSDSHNAVPTYLYMFKRYNSLQQTFGEEGIGFQLEAPEGALTRRTFYSKDSEGVYLSALINLQLLYIKSMAWVMTYESGMASALADRPDELDDEGMSYRDRVSNLKVYAKKMLLFNAFFEDLKAFKQLPHPCVFLHTPDDSAWFADPTKYELTGEKIGFYGGWHPWNTVWEKGVNYKEWTSRDSYGNLRQAHLQLPPEIISMADTDGSWGPPSVFMVEQAILEPMRRTGRLMQDLMLSAGAPGNGFYGFNEKGKPKFCIWLDDLSPVTSPGSSNAGYLQSFCKEPRETPLGGEYRRYYAKLHTGEVKPKMITFRITNQELSKTFCIMGAAAFSRYIDEYEKSPAERGVYYLGNYGEDKNFYYPALKAVRDVKSYYPWQRYADLFNATEGFNITALQKRYGFN